MWYILGSPRVIADNGTRMTRIGLMSSILKRPYLKLREAGKTTLRATFSF
jgi:hypothetical protein